MIKKVNHQCNFNMYIQCILFTCEYVFKDRGKSFLKSPYNETEQIL